MRILAIDNDPLILDLLCLCLPGKAGHQVIRAPDAKSALEVINNADDLIDCFLVDMELPGLDGIGMCQTIRAQTQYGATPIVVMTTQNDGDILERTVAAGATDFVSKPFDSMELSARVTLAGILNASLAREHESKQALHDLMHVPFDDAFSLGHVDGISDINAMENQLLRMGGEPEPMTLFAIEVQAAEALYQSGPSPAFRHYLEAISEAAAACLAGRPVLLSYGGRGIFVGALQGGADARLPDLQTDLDAKLKEIWSTTGTAPDVVITPVSKQRMWTGLSASDMLRGYLAPQAVSMRKDGARGHDGVVKLQSRSAR
ncbi:MAG: response regulator [Sulfitobacter sp.]